MINAPPAPTRPRRPFGLYAIIVTQVLLALLSAGLLALAGFAIIVAYATVDTGVTPEDLDLNVSDLVTLALMVVVNLICAVGLWRRQRWAWFLTMLQLGVFMLSDLYSFFSGDPPGTYAWSMLLNVVMVFYLNQREVQALFMRKLRAESPAESPAPPGGSWPDAPSPARANQREAAP